MDDASRLQAEREEPAEPCGRLQGKVAIAALKGYEMSAALTEKFDVHPTQITRWKMQLHEIAMNVFASASKRLIH